MSEIALPKRKDFIEHILKILKRVSDSNSGWTNEILKQMNKYAEELGLEFWGTGYNGEWLYDATFWYDNKDTNEEKLFACAEIEWKNNDEGYDHDYKKVLVAHTDIPSFITETANEESARDAIRRRLEVAKRFKHNPKPIIFVLYTDADDEYAWLCNEGHAG